MNVHPPQTSPPCCIKQSFKAPQAGYTPGVYIHTFICMVCAHASSVFVNQAFSNTYVSWEWQRQYYGHVPPAVTTWAWKLQITHALPKSLPMQSQLLCPTCCRVKAGSNQTHGSYPQRAILHFDKHVRVWPTALEKLNPSVALSNL